MHATRTDRPKKQRAAQQNIILLSSSPTALITMWNVKRFLEDGVYVLSTLLFRPWELCKV